MDRNPPTLTSDDTLGVNTMSSTIPITTRPSMFSNIFAETTTEGIASGRTLPQGRMSTLSSMVRPMPTTTTRTIAITREESQQDALETETADRIHVSYNNFTCANHYYCSTGITFRCQ